MLYLHCMPAWKGFYCLMTVINCPTVITVRSICCVCSSASSLQSICSERERDRSVFCSLCQLTFFIWCIEESGVCSLSFRLCQIIILSHKPFISFPSLIVLLIFTAITHLLINHLFLFSLENTMEKRQLIYLILPYSTLTIYFFSFSYRSIDFHCHNSFSSENTMEKRQLIYLAGASLGAVVIYNGVRVLLNKYKQYTQPWVAIGTVSELYIHPVKSARGRAVWSIDHSS